MNNFQDDKKPGHWYILVYIYKDIYIYIDMCVCIHLSVHVYKISDYAGKNYIPMCLCMYKYIHTYVCTYVHIHAKAVIYS